MLTFLRKQLAVVKHIRQVSDMQVLEKLLRKRVSENNFASTAVRDRTLTNILQLTLLAPSSFNFQPYKIIVVRDAAMKVRLAEGMLGGNKYAVQAAPVTAIFAADTEPILSVDDVISLEQQHGTSLQYLNSLRANATLLLGQGCVSRGLRQSITHLMSPIKEAPVIENITAWAYKNTALAAQVFMTAASAANLSTRPMEGFDARRVAATINLPQRYQIPMVISLGYSANQEVIEAEDVLLGAGDYAQYKKVRFDVEKQCYDNLFGQPFRPTYK